MGARYYVDIPKDDALHGVYTRKQAQDFARIGSQFGTLRRVWRRAYDDWVLVREYKRGKRVYPRTVHDCMDLTPGEIPTEWR